MSHTSFLELKQVICPSCKQAISSFSPFSSTVECPFCHNTAFNPLITAKQIPIPERIILFKTDKKDFITSLLEQLVNTDFVPSDLFSTIDFNKAIKAYLPMYLYEGRLDISWSCQIKVTPQDNNNRSNDGSSFLSPHSGSLKSNYAYLCLASNGNNIPNELKDATSCILYEKGSSLEFDPIIFDRENSIHPCLTVIPDEDGEKLWDDRVSVRLEEYTKELCVKHLYGQIYKNLRTSYNSEENKKGRVVLAPFWFIYYTYDNSQYYYLIDGSGKRSQLIRPVDEAVIRAHKKLEGKLKMSCLSRLAYFLWITLFIPLYGKGIESIYTSETLDLSLETLEALSSAKWFIYFSLIIFVYIYRKIKVIVVKEKIKRLFAKEYEKRKEAAERRLQEL